MIHRAVLLLLLSSMYEQKRFSSELANLQVYFHRDSVVVDPIVFNKLDFFAGILLVVSFRNPTWTTIVSTWSPAETKVYANFTYRVCDMLRMAPTNPFINAALVLAKTMTNFTFVCPLNSGYYYLAFETHMLSRILPFGLLYRPNSLLKFDFYFYEQASPRQLTQVATIKVGIVIKK